MGHVNMEIADRVHKRMKSVCALKGTTLIEFINAALKEKLAKEKI